MERHHPKILAGNNHCYPDLGAGPRNRQKVRKTQNMIGDESSMTYSIFVD